jgi:cell division transport system ATP-binding protein
MNETVLEIKNANIYQGDSLILSNVNIGVSKSEFVYLVGKTGTGKSSLLKTLYGELPLREGKQFHFSGAILELFFRTFNY